MILKKIQKQSDGGLETMWALTEEQTNFLLNYAIASLLQRGIIDVLLEGVEENEDQAQLAFLEELDTTRLPKA
jgi:hypothetical protein